MNRYELALTAALFGWAVIIPIAAAGYLAAAIALTAAQLGCAIYACRNIDKVF